MMRRISLLVLMATSVLLAGCGLHGVELGLQKHQRSQAADVQIKMLSEASQKPP